MELNNNNMKLKVKSMKYRDTINKGISFSAETNAKGVMIVNDGVGFPTYLDGLWKDIKPFHALKESELDDLVTNYEVSRLSRIVGTLTINY